MRVTQAWCSSGTPNIAVETKANRELSAAPLSCQGKGDEEEALDTDRAGSELVGGVARRVVAASERIAVTDWKGTLWVIGAVTVVLTAIPVSAWPDRQHRAVRVRPR
jgi:hypothetical protein